MKNMNEEISSAVLAFLARWRMSREDFADQFLGMTPSALSRRLRGQTPWTLADIDYLEFFGVLEVEIKEIQ